MSDYVVKQGECIASIAYSNGMLPQTIWDDEGNSALRKLRENPYVLLPGDLVHVPERRSKSEEIATGSAYTFRRKGVPEKFKLQVRHKGEPRAGEKYRLTVDGVETEGTTDGDGNVEQYIMPDAEAGTLIFAASGQGPAAEYSLVFKQLDPASEVSGQQARLKNLGLYHGEIDGVANEALRDALNVFQKRSELPVSGQADDATLQALIAAHGS